MMAKFQCDEEEETHSFGGSLAGGTLVSRRRKYHLDANEIFAEGLHGQAWLEDKLAGKKAERAPAPGQDCAPRCNSSFHHFRYCLVLMSGFALALMLVMRYGITISILKMVNQTHLYLEDHPNRTVDDFLAEGYSSGGEFNWNNEIVSIILSWYMLAYTIPQIPLTQLAMRIGCYKSVAISLAVCALSMLLTPICAQWGWQYVVVMRLLNGLGASAMVAISLSIVEVWMRPDEVSIGLSITQGVCSLLMFMPLLMGYLTEIHWAYSFYVPALCVLLFCLIWCLVAADRPAMSKLVSERELRHLSAGAGPQNGRPHQAAKDGAEAGGGQQRSWVEILKVPSFYAYLATWTIFNCANHGYIFILPTYLRQFLKIGVVDNGFYGLVIMSGSILPIIWSHFLYKILLQAGLSATKSRMVLQSLCCLGVSSTWIYIGLCHDHQILAFFINRCFFGVNDVLIPASLMANYGRLGLSSVAFAIMNSISDILIVPTSTFIGWQLDRTAQSRDCWGWIFVLLGLSHVALCAIFLVFIDSKPVEFRSETGNERHADKAPELA